ncbi:ABC transporter permease [Neobacillus sp. NPDC093182]|uniref:ABC transporter permease n=1 Tax=Neobacillus sp. NPDC093182 TaxID=3364297 RepID=UPI0038108F1E
MTFRRFAFNNVVRNKRLYAAYFLSSMFTVMVFFTFAIFSFHPALTGSVIYANVQVGMNIAAGIIYVFSFFFILYSMSSFLHTRKREFGLLMMQGMSIRQARLMVFMENILIGFFATIGGILLGLIFSKGILLVAENVLIMDDALNFYIPMQAVVITFVSFIVLFFFISLFISYILRSRKLIELIKGSKQSKGEPKANLLLTILAVFLIGIGYVVALTAKGKDIINVMSPVMVVLIIGTYLLFTQLSVYLIRSFKKNDHIFWNKTNMIFLSDLSFRMKDNARTFFIVAVVSTVAFIAIGTLVGFKTLIIEQEKEIKNHYPNPFSYTTSEEYTTNEQKEQDIALINETIKDANMEAVHEQTILRYYDDVNPHFVLVVRQSDFNRFASLLGENPIDVQEGKVKVVKVLADNWGLAETLVEQSVKLSSGVTLSPDEVIHSNVLPVTSSYYVISDQHYEELPASSSEEDYHAWQLADEEETILAASIKIGEEVSGLFYSQELQIYKLNKQYGLMLFVGLFIGIVFFALAGSFLYFRLYTDLDEDKQKFRSIARMGLTEKELKKVLTKQTAILFFTPIVVALIHGAIALTAVSHLFPYDLIKVSTMVLGVFLVIQIVYFYIVRYFYMKQVRTVL